MFNPEQKQSFISQYTQSESTAKVIEGLFNTIAKYEQQWGADICTRTSDEIRPVINKIGGLRSKSSETRLTALREYFSWCVRNNVEGAINSISVIEHIDLDKVREQMVSGPGHLRQILDVVFTKIDDQTVELTYAAYFYLAFCGLKESDAVKLTHDHFDFGKSVIKLGRVKYPIYPEFKRVLHECVTLEKFQYLHPNFAYDKERVPGSQVLRGFTELDNVETIRSIVSRKFQKAKRDGRVESKLSYNRVRLSGIFYKAYMRELNGICPDFSEEVSQFMKGREYSYKDSYTESRKIAELDKEFHTDYKRWKEAFRLNQ